MQANNERAVKGKLGEDFTADYLVKNGYDIITRNYRKPCGEIDIVASKGDILVFVEVKTRRYRSLVRYGSKSKKVPSSWLEAFDALINLLEEQEKAKHTVRSNILNHFSI